MECILALVRFQCSKRLNELSLVRAEMYDFINCVCVQISGPGQRPGMWSRLGFYPRNAS